MRKINKMSKEVRIRRMLSRGASAEQIVKALGCSKQYVYTVTSRMKKEIREKKWEELVGMVTKTGITLPPRVEVYTPEKHEVPPTLWQRFKAAIGF